MCGIFAAIRPAGLPPCRHAEAAVSKLGHRGPDAEGAWHGSLPWCCSVKLEWCQVDLGMARLKIVDQRHIAVPYQFDSVGVALAFNGEVYNWRELRASLGSSVGWETECDAEVIAKLWRAHGPAMLDRLNGMWGLVLVDTLVGEVFVARDRAGKKPLFYAQANGGGIYCASEAKALPVALEEVLCPDVEAFEFDCQEATLFRGVKRLTPGSYMHFRGPGDIVAPRVRKWWTLPPVELTDRSYADCLEELTALVISSVALRLSTEVPTALQLSGGLDSAIIWHAWSSISPESALNAGKYCVDFASDEIDNLSLAQRVAPDVLPVTFDAQELQAILPRIAYHLDTPATWSAVGLWKLAERISGDGNKVVLSGEGADELFGGYSRYRVLYWLQRMYDDSKLVSYKPTIEYLTGTGVDTVAKLLDRSRGVAARNYVISLVAPHIKQSDSLYRLAQRVEFQTTMQVLLRMGDRMASAWALENRCPFLDYRIIELASTFPSPWLITEWESKHILRDVARALGVDQRIVNEQTKRGLLIPWKKWSTELGVAIDGSRGVWDRGGYAALSRRAWREQCLRPADCVSCGNL